MGKSVAPAPDSFQQARRAAVPPEELIQRLVAYKVRGKRTVSHLADALLQVIYLHSYSRKSDGSWRCDSCGHLVRNEDCPTIRAILRGLNDSTSPLPDSPDEKGNPE